MIFAKRPERFRRLLIVEDEPLVAFDNEHFLIDAGYQIVATVDNLADARAAIRAGDIDLVLADVRLADGADSGMEVARTAHEQGVAVLFVTGADIPDHIRSFALGRLGKPYAQRDLRAAIEALENDDKRRKLPQGLTLFS